MYICKMQKCLSTLLAILLLFGGTGMVFGQHFCEGIVVDKSFAIGFETMSCADVEGDDACENNREEDDCCADTYFQLQTDKEFSGKSIYTTLDVPSYAASEANFILEAVAFSKEQRSFTFYTPPERAIDLLTLLQTYLI